MESDRVAIIDCGTNTFHLLIAEMRTGKLIILHQEKRVVKIGEGGISKGEINQMAMERALAALTAFSNKIRSLDVKDTMAFATSAFRSAVNGSELAAMIEAETGIHIQIINGEREAELIYNGVRFALKNLNECVLVMDIGGGSVEFIIGRNEEVLWKHSYEIGAQRLIDMFYTEDPIPAGSIDGLRQYLKKELSGLGEAISIYSPQGLIGSSGSFETLSEIYMQKKGISPDSSSELPLTSEAFESIYRKLVTLPRDERLKIPGMLEMRVDMIVVASILIDYVMDILHPAYIRISKYALKEGVLSEWLNQADHNA